MNLKSDFEKYGRVWLRNALSENELSYLDEAADTQVKAAHTAIWPSLIMAIMVGTLAYGQHHFGLRREKFGTGAYEH
ncbi:hypothetical protein [Cohaesibacter gelatinilyticus]|uniref:Uncharacterized protein n=1 Tax=Cohaesibacter gelatinilyticus TaxID=372072 RepID=A0A285PCB0_9HYPH|nr:hypothetical protein [Cohaesibacter gelatinilyticus]SNZ19375.1 hypothetical protein SAMN06265368_2459 [Cohaesibacter gelatinilyticus]